MSYDNILLEVTQRLAAVTINRPKVLNALNRATLGELEDAFRLLKVREDVGVVILRGAGDKAFVAGADIKELAELSPVAACEYALKGQGVLSLIENLGKPVIASVQGFALGGGAELAMAATLRVASEDAVFGQPEVTLGLIPGFAGTQRLSRLVGKGKAMELILTAGRIDAREALALGLVNRVVPRDSLARETHALATCILGRAPRAVAYAMEAIHRGLDMGFEEACQLEATLFGLVFSTEDVREGTRAFLEKRDPRFTGR